MSEQSRLPSDVVEARLNHLIDRARRGALLPDEADRFTTELRDLVRRLEDTEDERDRANKAIRHILGIAPDARVTALEAENAQLRDALAHCRHKTRVTELEAEVARLTQAVTDADQDAAEAREHTEQTCEAVTERDHLRATIDRVRAWAHDELRYVDRTELLYTIDHPPQPVLDEEPRVHLAKGTNAEDCPGCRGTNLPYPFLCPGPANEESIRA